LWQSCVLEVPQPARARSAAVRSFESGPKPPGEGQTGSPLNKQIALAAVGALIVWSLLFLMLVELAETIG
jgi:hypothetical protein